MSDTAKNILYDINTTIQNHSGLLEPVSHRSFIDKNDFNQIMENSGHKKHVNESSMRISLANEILTSEKFMTCVPIIIQDQLNGYAALGHYSESFIGSFNNNSDLRGNLNQLSEGSLIVKLLYQEGSCSIETIKHALLQNRKDIISIEAIKLPNMPKREYFDITYVPKKGEIFVTSKNGYGDKVYHIDGLHRNINQKIPQYELLKGHFAQNIANTFFL